MADSEPRPMAAAAAPDGSIDITVVIPSKNRPDLVRRAVATALAQVDVSLEVIVVDDGSEPSIPLSVGNGDPRLRILRNDQSQRVAAARNRGVAEARGAWIAFLDDDDVWSPVKLREQLAEVKRSGAEWCLPGTVLLDGDLRVRGISDPPMPAATLEALLDVNCVGSPSGVLVSTKAVRDVGGFDGQFSVFADWDLWLRLAVRSPCVGLAQPLVGYVTHDGSMHRQALGATRREFAAFAAHHRKIGTGEVRGLRTWEWAAWAQHDDGRRRTAAVLLLFTAVRWRSLRNLRGAVRMAGENFLPRRPVPPAPPSPPWVAALRAAS